MQLSLEIIDALRSIARYTAGFLSEASITPNHFWSAPPGGPGSYLPKYKMGEISLVCFCGDGTISFKDVRPNRILSIDVGPTVTFNEQVDDIHVYRYENAGETEVKKHKVYTEEDERTEQMDILSEIQMAVKGKISGSYAGFSAELETQLSAKLGINHSEKNVHKRTQTDEEDFDIPAWTDFALTQEHSVSDVKQSVKIRCSLDASVCLDGGWKKEFDTLQEMELYLKGGGGGKNATVLDDFVGTRVFEMFVLPTSDQQFVIEKERISRNVSTGKVIRTDTPITH